MGHCSTKPLAEYLEDHSIPEPNSGCLLWTRGTSPNGYGQAFFKRRRTYAHRLAWASVNGPIPPGFAVCHKCDVPSCINPAHLWLGRQADNMADMAQKKRRRTRLPGKDYSSSVRYGESSPQAKLTEEMVRRIRTDMRPVKILASELGVSQEAIYHIKANRTWRHVT